MQVIKIALLQKHVDSTEIATMTRTYETDHIANVFILIFTLFKGVTTLSTLISVYCI